MQQFDVADTLLDEVALLASGARSSTMDGGQDSECR